MRVGILGLQGCCLPHQRHFEALGASTRRILYPSDLADCQGLVLPGGESTTMLKTAPEGLWEALGDFARTRPVWGVCAGCILMARGVSHPAQRSLALLDLDVVRNAYGAQNESFIARLPIALPETPEPFECVFIRAPRISRVGPGLQILARQGEDPVMVSDGRHLVSTFHPELTDQRQLHQHFLSRLGRD